MNSQTNGQLPESSSLKVGPTTPCDLVDPHPQAGFKLTGIEYDQAPLMVASSLPAARLRRSFLELLSSRRGMPSTA